MATASSSVPLTNGSGSGTILDTSSVTADSPLDLLDVTHLLVLKKPDELEGPDIRGGHPDALVIHATKANKNGTKAFFYTKL